MGYEKHQAIIVVGCYQDGIDRAHDKASTVFPWVSPIGPAGMNGWRSFFVPPDGSKEGWTDSDIGDGRRDEFIRYLEGAKYEDGSSPLLWVEVVVDEDGHHPRVERSARGAKKRAGIEENG